MVARQGRQWLCPSDKLKFVPTKCTCLFYINMSVLSLGTCGNIALFVSSMQLGIALLPVAGATDE